MHAASPILRFLGGRVAPMVYIMMFINIVIGFCFLTGLIIGNAESVLYATGVLVNRELWGGLLLFTSSISMLGFFLYRDDWIRVSGFAGAVLWVFAAVALATAAHWYVLITIAMFHMLFHFYVYLAASLDIFYREPVSK